mmetsp:Transcript_125314/g.400557  ORF Transcript_125314/g.400557 Transcript_125314/m.400557 type:complete len:259 (+) Transcript_125314:112-888(+)
MLPFVSVPFVSQVAPPIIGSHKPSLGLVVSRDVGVAILPQHVASTGSSTFVAAVGAVTSMLAAGSSARRRWRSGAATRCAAAATAEGADGKAASEASCGVCGLGAVAGPVLQRRSSSALVAGLLVGAWSAQPGQVKASGGRSMEDDDVNAPCPQCAGKMTVECYPCRGTGQQTGGKEGFFKCEECEGAGRRPCFKCYATGLNRKQIKFYRKDREFRNVMAGAVRQIMDKESEGKLKATMTDAVAKVKAKMGMMDGMYA